MTTMTWGFLTLPKALQSHIVTFMFPVLVGPKIFFRHAYRMEKDIDDLFGCLKNLQNFAMTNKEVFGNCFTLLLSVQKLKFNDERVLVKERPDGTVFPVYRFAHFLALAYSARSGNAYQEVFEMEAVEEQQIDVRQLQIERNRPLDPYSIDVTELERSIASVFRHFASVNLLDLTDFPLTLTNLWSLELLKELRVLAIRSPRADCKLIPNVQMIHTVCILPRIKALSFVVHNWKETKALSNVVKLFERSIQALSIAGRDYETGGHDIISGILFNPVHQVNMPLLRSIHIDFLEFCAKGLRNIAYVAPSLESMVVDCRGIEGFLPLFYVIDVIRIVNREAFDAMPMMMYDLGPTNIAVEGDPLAHYRSAAKIWLSRMSKFHCRFKFILTPNGPVKVLDGAEFFFATSDGNLTPINTDIAFHELAEVFYSRAYTFHQLKELTIATESQWEFVPSESVDQLKELTSNICRDYLPSVEKVSVRWGETQPFFWKSGEIQDMPIDTLWSFGQRYYKTEMEW